MSEEEITIEKCVLWKHSEFVLAGVVVIGAVPTFSQEHRETLTFNVV